MKKWLFLLVVFLFLFETSLLSNDKLKEPSFTLITHGDNGACARLVGEYPKNMNVFLIDSVGFGKCMAVTGSSYIHDDGVNTYHVTDILKCNCNLTDNFELAYLGYQKTYKKLNPKIIKSGKDVNDVDKLLRSKKIRNRSQDKKYDSSLAPLPILYEFSLLGKRVFIAQYLISPTYNKLNYGPIYFYGNKKAILIDEEAEIRTIFELNGNTYLFLNHRCWIGCGDLSYSVIEIDPDNYNLIMYDSSWSN